MDGDLQSTYQGEIQDEATYPHEQMEKDKNKAEKDAYDMIHDGGSHGASAGS